MLISGIKKSSFETDAKHSGYERRHWAARVTIAAAAILTVLGCVISLGMGRYFVPFNQVVRVIAYAAGIPIEQTWTDRMQDVVLLVRLPRVLGAALIGAALSLSGVVYQGVFHNPLVSPDILGVSSGAAVGASVAILCHAGGFLVQVSALAGGGAAVLLAITISHLFMKTSPLTLVLSGIIVSALCSSLLSVCQFAANVYEELPAIVFWTMGSLRKISNSDLAVTVPVIVIVSAVLIAGRWRINLLSLGDDESRTLGLNVRATRALTITCSTVITAFAVCVSGTISWVGLIIPHLARFVTGNDNRFAVPASALFGAIFLTVVDTTARCLSPSEIPISAITGIICVPIFVFIIVRKRFSL